MLMISTPFYYPFQQCREDTEYDLLEQRPLQSPRFCREADNHPKHHQVVVRLSPQVMRPLKVHGGIRSQHDIVEKRTIVENIIR